MYMSSNDYVLRPQNSGRSMYMWIYIFVLLIPLYGIVYLFNKKQYLVFAYIVSTIHALIVGCWGLWLLRDKDITERCLVDAPTDNWLLIHIIIAYLLADAICVVIWHSKYDIVVHHLLSACGLIIASHYRIGYGICVRFAITELSTIPLNICWYLRKRPNTSKYVLGLAASILIIIFFLVRILPIPNMLQQCYPQLWQHTQLPLFFLSIHTITYMLVMNIVWFYRIVLQFIRVMLLPTLDKKNT